MQISNNVSPSFGSIQVAYSQMNSYQRNVSEKFFRAVKYSDEYAPYVDKDVDIYVLPSKNKNADVEILFMDPYSGRFYRGKNGKIIKRPLKYADNDRFWNFTDKIIEEFKKMAMGAIKRPTADIHKVVMGKTEMTKLNPDKKDESVYAYAKALINSCNFTKEEAENAAYEDYISLYHQNNKDADF